MSGNHAEFAPSAAYRWLRCPGSATMKHPPETESDAAKEGTRVHHAINRALVAEELPLDPQDAAYVRLVLDYIAQLPAGEFWYESRVDIVPGACWGTLDIGHWDPAQGVLTIIDYKNGGMDVEAVENDQLMTYAAGLMKRLGIRPRWLRLVIVQPNSRTAGDVEPIKQHLVPVERIDAHVAAINEAVTRTDIVAGPHCRYCPSFGVCPRSVEFFQLISNALALPYDQIPDAALTGILRTLRGLEDWADGAKAEGKRRMMLPGRPPVPGLTLGTSATHRKYRDPLLAANEAFNAYGAAGVVAKPPKQLEDMGADGKRIVGLLAFKPPGGVTLKY